MNRKKYLKTREKVLKTDIGKKTYKKLTISTILLILSLLGLAVIMTMLCKYCIQGNSLNNILEIMKVFPIFFISSFITWTTTCFYSGEYSALIKSNNKK